MGDVVPFIAKVRSSGDWNAAERARLEELAQRLSAGGARVEAVFGATDDGDPWCVVTDENGDVLIHVARIGGKFVIHSAIDDSLTESTDLPSALREQVMAYGSDEEGGVVVPFSLAGRQAQSFLALVIASAFFYETAGTAGPLDVVESRPETLEHYDPPPPPPDIETPTQERELAVQGAAIADAHPDAAPSTQPTTAAEAETPEPVRAAATPVETNDAAPVELAKAEAAPQAAPELILTVAEGPTHVIRGTAGDDVLVGTAGDDRVEGGDGNDTLSGGGGGRDVLLGGAGDDRIDLGAQVTATGGEGADAFVIQAPAVMGDANTLLGVVTDFSFAQGDTLVWNGQVIQLPEKPGEPSGSGGGGGAPNSPPSSGGGGNEFGLTTLGPARKVELDLDGDGRIDGYVLLGGPTQAGENQPIVVTGQGSSAEAGAFGI
ncbi:calcium-binding protein [Phenylobacterium sp.]|uniref:calcium-binding protein n=1 Tax=Phenylobacterium sp. TaxID=1871053 RepID=UPI0039209D13